MFNSFIDCQASRYSKVTFFLNPCNIEPKVRLNIDTAWFIHSIFIFIYFKLKFSMLSELML